MRNQLSRRELFEAAGAGAIVSALPLIAQGAPQAPPATLPALNRFPRMVQEYFVAQGAGPTRPLVEAYYSHQADEWAALGAWAVLQELDHDGFRFEAEAINCSQSPGFISRSACYHQIFVFGHKALLPAEIGLSGTREGVTLLPYLMRRQPSRGGPLDPAQGRRER